jgi:hypothetical protein
VLGGRRRVDDAAKQAYAAWEAQDWDRAAALLDQLLEVAAREGFGERSGRKELAGWAFDLALAHKFRRDWPAARETGRRVAELAGADEGEPAWWNLGIAATALHDWPLARECWTRYGVDVPPGVGPPDGDLGQTPVRLRTSDGGAEVVWCRRVDPARARVLSIPVAGSGRRWGEVVLHDGVPNGSRVVDGDECPVFDEIELWQPSDVAVQSVRVRVAADADLEALHELADLAEVAVERWDTLARVCQACSEGRLDQTAARHEHGADTPGDGFGRFHLGVAADRARTDRLLAAWVAAEPARRGAGEPETVA